MISEEINSNKTLTPKLVMTGQEIYLTNNDTMTHDMENGFIWVKIMP